ncbi:MAG TPA: ATP-binding protein [Bacteroidota bacterium]
MDKDIVWTILVAAATLLTLSSGLISMVILGRRRLIKSQRKQVEELRASEQKYRNLFESSLVGMIRFSLHDWTMLESNDAFKKMFAKISSKSGDNFLSCLLPENQTKLKEELYGKGYVENFESQIECSDDVELWISFSGRVSFKDGYVEGVVSDITSRVKAEETMREHAALLEKAHDAIVVLTLENTIQFWNPGAENLFLWHASDAVGRSITDLIYSEEEQPAFWKRRDEMFLNGEWSGELVQVRKDGKRVITTSRWTLIRGSDGNPKSILEIYTDMTEKRLLGEKYLRIQRLESLGILAGGIAHDLNNVLAPIIVSIQSLRRRWDDPQSRNNLAMLEASVQRGAELIKQVTMFARGVEGERVEVGPGDLVNEVISIISRTIPKPIKLESAVADDLWTVAGDRRQLLQVIVNLCMNAKDAMPRGGTLSLTAENAVVDERIARSNPEAKPGIYVMIQVTDTGTGIPTSDLDKIFEPFYTTKSLEQGTGLGLSTALGIVRSHRGFIMVESTVGLGTTFTVYLPAHLYQSANSQSSSISTATRSQLH